MTLDTTLELYQEITRGLIQDFNDYFKNQDIISDNNAYQNKRAIEQYIQSGLNTIPLEKKQLSFNYFKWCLIVNKDNTYNDNITPLLPKNFDTERAQQDVLTIQRFFRKKMAIKIYKTLYNKDIAYFVPFENLSCTSDLRDRILNAFDKIHFITQIQHKTTLNALQNMLASSASGNELLMYGACNILAKKNTYIPSALGEYDINNGDANMICFGLAQGEVDGLCDGDTTIIIDFQKFKLYNKGSSISVKDHDFAFCTGCMTFNDHIDQNITLKDVHNSEMSFIATIGKMSFQIIRTNNKIDFNINGQSIVIETDHATSACYNTSQIEKFLVLQFFRFIEDSNFPSNIKAEIYQQLSTMQAAELEMCIVKIAENLSKRAEINVYGAATVNDDCIASIFTTDEDAASNIITHNIALSDLICTDNGANLMEDYPTT